MTALSYTSGYLTDGKVDRAEHMPTLAVETFGLTSSALKRASKAADELVERGLWRATDAGWRFHDWKDNNPSAAQVRRRKRHDKRRDWLHKTTEGRALKKLVRDRDGDLCSWCGEPVRWGANRAPDGATYDHVDPNGPDVDRNVVVACNSCNGSKRDVDHAEVGMHLRPGHALTHLYQEERSSDATPSASSRLSRDSVATELPRSTSAGAGRVGIGSGLAGAGQAVTGRRRAAHGSPEAPPPDDDDYTGDEL